MAKRPALFETSLDKIQIGRFTSLTTAPPSSTLFEILQLIERTHFSAIPIVNEDGLLLDTVYKSDLYRIPPGDLLAVAATPIDPVLKQWREKNIIRKYESNTCTVNDTMEVVLAKLMDYKLRSIIVVDSSNHVQGIVALTDILRCFLV